MTIISLSLSHYHFLHHLTALHLQTDKLPSNLQQLVRLLQQGAIASCPRLWPLNSPRLRFLLKHWLSDMLKTLTAQPINNHFFESTVFSFLTSNETVSQRQCFMLILGTPDNDHYNPRQPRRGGLTKNLIRTSHLSWKVHFPCLESRLSLNYWKNLTQIWVAFKIVLEQFGII